MKYVTLTDSGRFDNLVYSSSGPTSQEMIPTPWRRKYFFSLIGLYKIVFLSVRPKVAPAIKHCSQLLQADITLINRTGVAGAVLQTALSFIDSVS